MFPLSGSKWDGINQGLPLFSKGIIAAPQSSPMARVPLFMFLFLYVGTSIISCRYKCLVIILIFVFSFTGLRR